VDLLLRYRSRRRSHKVSVDANTGKVVADSKEAAAQEAKEASQKQMKRQNDQDKLRTRNRE